MTDYTKLVQALRCANRYKNFTKDCDSQNPNEPCRYCHHWLCEDDRIFEDAAAAIEDMAKHITEMHERVTVLQIDRGHLETEVKEWRRLNNENLLPKRRHPQRDEAEAQLPKRGEWELIDEAEPMRWGCSRCKYLSWETSSYCPRCGAKMMEVQDGQE